MLGSALLLFALVIRCLEGQGCGWLVRDELLSCLLGAFGMMEACSGTLYGCNLDIVENASGKNYKLIV